MKLFIIAFAFVAALCNAEPEFQQPEESVLLDPGFLTSTSWAHQAAYHALQDEIDATFVEINQIVAASLARYSSSALVKYSNHSVHVLAVYDPVFDRTLSLPSGNCRTTVTNLLQNTVIQSGFSSSNCSATYAQRTQAEANGANEVLKDFAGEYGSVVLNVYQSYVGKNAMVESEVIEANINNTFASVAANWNNIGPAIDQLRTTLNNNINTFTNQLEGCFYNAYGFTVDMIGLVAQQVSICETWNGGRSGVRAGNRNAQDDYEDLTEKFNELVASHKPYQWD